MGTAISRKPDCTQTSHFLDRLLLAGALLCTCSGVIFFFAYNWHGLGRLEKFALGQMLVALPFVVLLKYPLSHRVAQSALLAAGLLLGALLALIGQTYQSGADAFELFLLWALLLLPWLVLGRSRWLGALVVVLLNLALQLAFIAFARITQDMQFALALGLNLLLWLPVARLAWTGRAMFWRVANGLLVAWLLVISTGWAVLALWRYSGTSMPGTLVWLVTLWMMWLLYGRRNPQRPLQLLCVLSAGVWGMALLGKWLGSSTAVFLVQGGFILAVGFGAYVWLRPDVRQAGQPVDVAARADYQQPLYMRVFFTALAWLAAQSFLLAAITFFGLLFGADRTALAPYAAAGGIVLLGAAIWLEHKKGNVFVQQLGVASAMTGQGLLILFLLLEDWLTSGTLALLQIPLFIVLRNSFLRTLCVPVLVIAGVDALGQSIMMDSIPLVLPLLLAITGGLYWLDERQLSWRAWLHPLRRGLTITLWLWLVLQQGEGLLLGDARLWAHQPLLLTLVDGAFLAWLLVNRIHHSGQRLFALALGSLVLVAGWLIPGPAVLAPLLVLAWLQGWRAYQVAHVLALLAALMFYYYNLDSTLLVKSCMLLGLAVLLLTLRAWWLRLAALPAAITRSQPMGGE